MAFYSCPTCDEVVREAIHVVSSDRCHDSNAVAHFTKVINQHLVDDRKLAIKRQIQFTDGCAGQYKSSRTFADISHAMDDLKCNVERNFFGSRHGKSESDGEGGVVKSTVSRAVTAEEVIVTDAESFYNFCNSRLVKGADETSDSCCHFKREFILVRKGDIDRSKKSREVKTVKGTRTLHCVTSVKGGTVKTRQLSRYCTGCMNSGDCLHTDYVDPWKLTKLQPVTHNPKQDIASHAITEHPTAEHRPTAEHPVSTGDFLAVAVAGKRRRVMYIARVRHFM